MNPCPERHRNTTEHTEEENSRPKEYTPQRQRHDEQKGISPKARASKNRKQIMPTQWAKGKGIRTKHTKSKKEDQVRAQALSFFLDQIDLALDRPAGLASSRLKSVDDTTVSERFFSFSGGVSTMYLGL